MAGGGNMNYFLNFLVENFVLRKITAKYGATKDNAKKPSTVSGAVIAGAGILPEEVYNAIPLEYQLIVRGILLLIGGYFIVTEKA
jgi:hypothetical protein